MLKQNTEENEQAKERAFVSVLSDVTGGQWLLLLAAIAAYPGPGLALAAYALRIRRRLDLTQELALGFALSLALWTALFGVLSPFDLALPTWSAWGLGVIGWAAYGYRHWRGRRSAGMRPAHGTLPAGAALSPAGLMPLRQDASPWLTAALWAVILAAAALSLWVLGSVVVQPGSDGYHHTLIAQAIAEGGRIPDGLAPLTWLVTFTYHFGYHVFVAVLNWMTGISVVALVPIAAQLLKAAAALAVAFLTEAVGERRLGGIVAAVVTGLVCVFPAAYVNWGRNTQVAGLVILAVLLGVVWLWCGARPAWRTAGLIALLAVGLALVHYRVTLMAALGCLVIIVGRGWQARWGWPQWRTRIGHGAAMVAVALLLTLPWIWQVRSNGGVGYPATVGMPEGTFFELDRLGGLVLDYPTNLPLLIVLAAALLWGLWKRALGVWVMALWTLLLYVFSQPWALSQYMDTVSVVISLFVPGSVVLGLAAVLLHEADGGAWRWRSWLAVGLTALLGLGGAGSLLRIIDPGAAYVLPQDMGAVEWVQEHTPPDALFMVNTYAFPFAPEYVIGSDAGGWLPVLARRRVVTAPMTYPIERSSIEHYPQQIAQLGGLSADLGAPEAVARLRALGVTHVFVGARGGPIAVDKLLASPAYTLEFHDGSVYVFALRGGGAG